MSATQSLHYELCCKAAVWIRQRRNAEPWKAAYTLSAVELICYGAENPDVYAFNGAESAIIEVKTSHADFLADQKKASRTNPEYAMADFRYYLCPEGVINPDEVPDKWGLLYYKDGRIHKVRQAEQQDSCKIWDMLLLSSIMRREGLLGKTYNYRNKKEQS